VVSKVHEHRLGRGRERHQLVQLHVLLVDERTFVNINVDGQDGTAD
jgi:hypothetical protein